MNLMNQRRDLQDLYDAGVITATMLKSALNGPVFVCSNKHAPLSDNEKEWVAKNVMHDSETSKGCFPRIVPFNVFRTHYPSDQSYSQWWFNMLDGHAVGILYGGDQRIPSERKIKNVHFKWGINRNSPQVVTNIWVEYVRASYQEEMLPSTQGVFNATMRDLVVFLFDIMSSNSSVIKVTDAQPGRSVQWRLNREHYLVLNRNQAQTIQKHRRGVTDKDLVRGAHWRRAHLRRLQSDKFKNKKGLLVPVRKAWVGPIEWKGHDGKIYKVTELSNPQ